MRPFLTNDSKYFNQMVEVKEVFGGWVAISSFGNRTDVHSCLDLWNVDTLKPPCAVFLAFNALLSMLWKWLFVLQHINDDLLHRKTNFIEFVQCGTGTRRTSLTLLL